MTLSAGSDDLTPWVATLGEPVRAELMSLLGLEPGAKLGFRPRTGAATGRLGALWVSLDQGGARVELDLADAAPVGSGGAARGAWLERHGLFLSYRRERDGSDPLSDPARATLLRAVRAHLELAPCAVLTAGVQGLVTALEQMERYREVDDRMYRQISRGSAEQNATIRLGFRCNQDCGMCWQGRAWPDPPEALALLWLDEIAAAGIEQVVFSGGEPTLYRSLPELLRRAGELGLRVELQTNAVLLRKPTTLNALCEAGLRRVFVSYHSHLPQVSDALTRAPGTHVATEAGIVACLLAGIEVQLNTVVERLNLPHLADHARAIVSRFVQPFADNPVRDVTFSYPTSYHDRELWRASVMPLDAIAPRLVEAARILAAQGLSVDASGAGCGFPLCVLRDEPGLIRHADLAQMDLKDSSARSHPPACDPCALRGECPGLRREYLEVHADRGVVPFLEVPVAR